MQHSYRDSLVEVLKDEGGYVNDPRDPGGATNKGITQRTYDAYLGPKRQRSVRLITDAEVSDIYKARYWDAVKADSLPEGLDYCVFDFAVNSGPVRAIRFLQSVLGVKVDGVIGQETLQAARATDTASAIRKLCAQRLDYLKFLHTWPTFGKGWGRRVARVEAIALHMAQNGPVVAQEGPAPVPATPVPPTPTIPASDVQKPSNGLWTWLKSLFSSRT